MRERKSISVGTIKGGNGMKKGKEEEDETKGVQDDHNNVTSISRSSTVLSIFFIYFSSRKRVTNALTKELGVFPGRNIIGIIIMAIPAGNPACIPAGIPAGSPAGSVVGIVAGIAAGMAAGMPPTAPNPPTAANREIKLTFFIFYFLFFSICPCTNLRLRQRRLAGRPRQMAGSARG